MTYLAPGEQIEFLAAQNFRYDNYSGYRYFLEHIRVGGKYGLACVEEQEGCGTHSRVLLQPVYREITVWKISTVKAIYDRYAVFADGSRVGDFTMVLNAWIPKRAI